MDLALLLNGLVASINELQAKLADANNAAQELANQKYEEGFAAGVASVPVSEKIYTQAELDAAVQASVLPLQEQIVSLQAQVDGMQAQIDAKVAEAMALFKADLLAKYEAQQVVESDSETGFKDLLK